MKLSELIAFRNQIDEFSTQTAQKLANQELNLAAYLSTQAPLQFVDYVSRFQQATDTINQAFDSFDLVVQELKQQVNLAVEQQEKHWFQESYKLYDIYMRRETPEYILNRRQKVSSEVELQFVTRLQNYTDWRFPGLIIRPGLEKFTHAMVPNDPLYLVDQSRDLLKPAVESFSEPYQRRLRTYVIDERATDPILQCLPDGQFGLCFVYNFFNFRPLELIRTWLNEIYTKLRPGGVLIMTINDCDREAGVILAENYYACYTPGRLILTMVESIGFEVLYTWNDPGPITWIEMRKPGELTSMRGGQTLAKIISESVAKSK